MQYRKNSLFRVLSTSVYSVQTADKSDTTDKRPLPSALVELAAGLLYFFFERVILQAALTTAFKFLLPPFSAGCWCWSSAGCPQSGICRQ